MLFAKKDFAAAAESEPGEPQAHYNRGLCLRELGRRAEAVEAFRAAVRCKPDAARPRRTLAELLAAERHAEARRLLEGLRPESPPRGP